MTSTWIFMIRALRHRNYRLFFSGQVISLIGTWMSMTASSWLVYRLTESAWWLGVAGFSSQFPSFLLAPLAGVYVDRLNRHRLLLITQILFMGHSFLFGALIFSHSISIPMIIFLNVIHGCINAFDIPCRQSLVISLLNDKNDINNAIALNSSMFNLARIIGPSLAGFVIALSTEGWCFVIDGLSFIAVIVALLMMTSLPQHQVSPAPVSIWNSLKEGWNYAAQSSTIRPIMIMVVFMGIVAIPYSTLVPIFAGSILQGGPHTLGFLMAASGLGAFCGALWLAMRKSVHGLGRAIAWAALVFGGGLFGLGLSKNIWLSSISLFAIGVGFIILIASSNTILQTTVDDNKRGRVMALFLMAILGSAPVGNLLIGKLAVHWGAPFTALICGVNCVACSLWFKFQGAKGFIKT